MRILFLDIDGVLNRSGFRPTESVGLHSWIEPELAGRLSEVLEATAAEVVLISDWRHGRELDQLRADLAAAGVKGAADEVALLFDDERRLVDVTTGSAKLREGLRLRPAP